MYDPCICMSTKDHTTNQFNLIIIGMTVSEFEDIYNFIKFNPFQYTTHLYQTTLKSSKKYGNSQEMMEDIYLKFKILWQNEQ